MKGPVIPQLGPLLKWLGDVEAVLTGRSVLVYRAERTNIAYVCVPTALFEHQGELWVVGRDPACNCVTGAPLRLCSVTRVGQER